MDLAQRVARLAIRPRRRLAVAMVAAAFNVVACLLVIPRFGVEGASWLTVSTEFPVMIAYDDACKEKYGLSGSLVSLGACRGRVWLSWPW